MTPPEADPATLETRLRRLVCYALLVVQAVVAFSPLAEARGGSGFRPHVEARGDWRHYAHADANCAYCAVRTIHAPAASLAQRPRVAHAPDESFAVLAPTPPTAPSLRSQLSRAPPAA